MDFKLRAFDELSVDELYGLIQLRQQVFIIEQYCVYQDLDDVDKSSFHLMALIDSVLVGYSRLIPQDENGYCSIGRVVLGQEFRAGGRGRELMLESIRYCKQLFHEAPIKIHAQAYLLDFYVSLGFAQIGSHFYEDGIPHLVMTR